MSFSFCLIAENRSPLKLVYIMGDVLKRCPRVSFVIRPHITSHCSAGGEGLGVQFFPRGLRAGMRRDGDSRISVLL